MSYISFYLWRQIGMTRLNLDQSISLEPVDHVVSLYTQTFTSAHFNEWFSFVFVRKFKSEFFGRRWRKDNKRIRKVHTGRLAFFGKDRGHALSNDFLRVCLSRVNHVVHGLSLTEEGCVSRMLIRLCGCYPNRLSVGV